MPRAPARRETEDDTKPEKIPRPPNAWILYRGDRLNQWKASRSPNDAPVKQADISRLIAARWKQEDNSIKLEYEKRAAIAKAEHKKRYPDYKYNPISKEAKERMRAEEREAKKRAREEAKAAKAARSSLGHYREPSYPSPPSGSDVKLDNVDSPPEGSVTTSQVVTVPRVVVEPIERGCGPSPPIDYDPQSPSSSSVSSSSSSSLSSSLSATSSPLRSSSQLSPTPNDASQVWQSRVPSPLSSPPTHPPPPAYPSTLVHSPAPSRQSSYNFFSSSASTPSDSPPSYSEGESWQPSPPDSDHHSCAPLPDFQTDWNTPLQDPLLLQPDVSFPLPQLDPLLSIPENEQLNTADAASAGAIFDLSAPHTASANSPPGELELDPDAFAQQLASFGEQLALHPPADQLGPMLDMAELHETMEDRAQEAGIPVLGLDEASHLENFAAFVNAHPQDTMTHADPNFYHNLGMQFFAQFPHLVPSLLPQGMAPPQYMADPNNMSLAVDFAPMLPQSQDQTFQSQEQTFHLQGQTFQSQEQTFHPSMYEMFAQQPQIAMPMPTHPIPLSNMAAVPTPELSHSLAGTPHTEVVSTPVDSAPAHEAARPRYVPPVGASLVGRRRVGGRHYLVPRPHSEDSD